MTILVILALISSQLWLADQSNQQYRPLNEQSDSYDCNMQAKGVTGDGMLQKLQRSVSAKATPLLALAGIAQPLEQNEQGTHELVPLKAKLQQLDLAPSGSQSIEPLLQAGGLKLN